MQTELNQPAIVERPRDLTEVGRIDALVGVDVERWVIQRIRCLGAEQQRLTFFDFGFFRDREVQIGNCRTIKHATLQSSIRAGERVEENLAGEWSVAVAGQSAPVRADRRGGEDV